MSPALESLLTEGAALNASIKASQTRLKEINAALTDLGEAKYEPCAVIAPGPSVGFPDEPGDQEKVRELVGDNFSKLFDRNVSYKPVKAFREVAAALLTPGTAKKLIALCSSAKSAYVKWL